MGLQCYSSTGQIQLDTAQFSPCLVDVFSTTAGTNGGGAGSKSYPEYAGCTVEIYITGNGADPMWDGQYAVQNSITVDYALGYPRISWGNLSSSWWNASLRMPPSYVYVLILTRPASTLQQGVQATSDYNNEIITYSEYNNLHFIGKATYTGGGQFYTYQYLTSYYRTYTITSPSLPIIFISDAGGSVASVWSITQSGSTYTIKVATDGATPVLYCFAALTATSIAEPGAYGMAIYKSDGTLAMDSTAKPLCAKGYATLVDAGAGYSVSPPGYSSSPTPTSATALSYVGVVPTNGAYMATATMFRGFEYFDSGRGYYYISSNYLACYRSGSTYYSKYLKISGNGPYGYNTIWPISSNTGMSSRMYVIDRAAYD
jgi:hypothetical protein